jgi:hypothetical protein
VMSFNGSGMCFRWLAGHKAFVELTGARYQAFEVVQAFEITRQHHFLGPEGRDSPSATESSSTLASTPVLASAES